MPIQVAILGLGRLGASLAAALGAREDFDLTGFDSDGELARLAQSRGLIKRIDRNLLKVAARARLVLLALPLPEQREALKAIAADLQPGCVIASLGSLLAPPLEWAAKLPPERHFVACHPVANPANLFNADTGLDAARPDLFTGGLWAMAASPACAPEALKLISDLATLLGAAPYFVDPVEHDGLMGGAGSLPTALAWALMQAASDSPGWSDMRKVADHEFAAATAALAEPADLLLNRDSLLRYLDAALIQLQRLRDLLARGKGAAVDEALAEAANRRARWLADRLRGEWLEPDVPRPDLPTSGEHMARFLVGSLFKRKRDD